jgi:acetyl-CoA carboxylase carboxyl transferase subunit alpha
MKDTLARLLESAQPVNGQEQKTENTAALLGNGKSQENSTENTAAKATQKTAMEIVRAARDAHRPTTREFIDAIFTDFLELHGDRQFGDDGAIVGGIARFQGREVTVVGIQKGRNLDENIATNFGSPHPEGYRKALRLMKQAEKFGRPIVTFINTAGAYCGIGAEERGQGEAIAMNLMEMIAIKVPIICILIGEGGSGGALALGVGDQVWALENSMYAILSPEGFASILWRDPSRVEEAATRMKLTAPDLLKQHVIEEIIPEATDGIAQNPSYTMEAITKKLEGAFKNLCAVPTEELLENRYNRYRSFGEFEE